MIKKHRKTALYSLLVLLLGQAHSVTAQTVVSEFAPAGTTDPGIWFESDVRQAGVASVVDLTGAGGELETNQPLPPGAALITTEFDDGDKAEVGILGDYGFPADTFGSLNVGYSFLKAGNPGQNLSAAPAIKLTFFNPVCDDPASGNDCFGTLVYEPTWNGPGSTPGTPVSTQVDTDMWTAVSIDQNNGLFWWTGGFGQPNTAGGPPINTLAGWLGVFSSDFQDATLISVSVGVGTFNQGQIGYFDDVSISHTAGAGIDQRFDFGPDAGPPIIVPTLSTVGLAVLLAALLLIGIVRAQALQNRP